MKLQVTLDTYSVEDGISLVQAVADYIDIIEVGTPLLLDTGMLAVERVKEAFPNVEVLADTKIWHNGARISRSAFEHGADMVTILAGASDREVEAVVSVAESYGRKVAADMSEVGGLVQRSAELEDLGVSYLMVPSGLRRVDEERDGQDAFHRNTRAMGGTPLALVRNVMRNLSSSAEVAVVDNITLDNLDAVIATHPGILLVGRAILAADDPLSVASEFKRRMEA
ncbi:MAG: orotidine 5'-phosphate decarboxylase [Atopobiaceae bacterium]|nr:orotidine 5'-phosphate decarboxylase [Atopobiaceae bacterium]